MMLPSIANALELVEEEVLVETPDGMANCYFVRPVSEAHAAVIAWPDPMGIRTSFRVMGKRPAFSWLSVAQPFLRSTKLIQIN